MVGQAGTSTPTPVNAIPALATPATQGQPGYKHWTLPKFDDNGDDKAFDEYDNWCFKVESALFKFGLSGVIDGTDTDVQKSALIFCQLAEACEGNALTFFFCSNKVDGRYKR